MTGGGPSLDGGTIETTLARLQGGGGAVHVHQEVGSTNDLALDLAVAGAPDWTLVVAEGQTRGRGRRGRSWSSPVGKNLYWSLITPEVGERQHWPILPLLAGVAAVQAIYSRGASVHLKWPNDLLGASGGKLGGILVEGAKRSPARAVVGMGLNANAAAEDLPQGATSLRIERGACWDRNQLAAELVASCQHWWAVLEAKGFAPIREAWLHSACWLDRQVVVTGEGGHWTGTLLGIDQWGRLRLATGEGEHVISAGDVSLRVADGAG